MTPAPSRRHIVDPCEQFLSCVESSGAPKIIAIIVCYLIHFYWDL